MKRMKRIGLVAHDAKKHDMAEWARHNAKVLCRHELTCTGTTGSVVAEVLADFPDVKIKRLRSGPLGGDQQMGSLIAAGKIDVLFFFIDPMSPQPHDVDVRALERVCAVENIVLATTRSSADFIISSPLFEEDYLPIEPNYDDYLRRLESRRLL